MLFNTWPFLIFLLVVLPMFFALRKTKLWLPWLTLASLGMESRLQPVRPPYRRGI